MLPEKIREQLSSYLYLSSLYFLGLGALYLWAYWSHFDVKVMEYIDLADILKLTAYPLAAAATMTVIGASLGQGLVDRGGVAGVAASRPDWMSHRLVQQFPAILNTLCVLAVIFLLIFGSPSRWSLVAALAAIPISAYLRPLPLIETAIPNFAVRSVLTFVLGALPFHAYGFGEAAAERIRSGREFVYTISGFPEYPASLNPRLQPRLVGKVGDHIFLFDPAASAILVAKIDASRVLAFKSFKDYQVKAPPILTKPFSDWPPQ